MPKYKEVNISHKSIENYKNMVKKKRHRETQMLNTELKYDISGVIVDELSVSTVILVV